MTCFLHPEPPATIPSDSKRDADGQGPWAEDPIKPQLLRADGAILDR